MSDSMTCPGDLGGLCSRLLKEQREQADLAVACEDEGLTMGALRLLSRSEDGASVLSIVAAVDRPWHSVLRFLEAAERLGTVRRRNAIRWEIAWPEGFKYRQETP